MCNSHFGTILELAISLASLADSGWLEPGMSGDVNSWTYKYFFEDEPPLDRWCASALLAHALALLFLRSEEK